MIRYLHRLLSLPMLPAPVSQPRRERRPVPGQTAIWRAAVQARLDFNLPAGTVEHLVRNGLAALARGESLTDVLVTIRQTGIRLRGRVGGNGCPTSPGARRIRPGPEVA